MTIAFPKNGEQSVKKGAGCLLFVLEFAVHIAILWLCTFGFLSKWGTIPFMIIFPIILCVDVHRYAKRTSLADKGIVYQLLFVNLWDVIRYRSLKKAVYRQSYGKAYGKQNKQAASHDYSSNLCASFFCEECGFSFKDAAK